MLSVKDIAWAAGFLEGEGCFSQIGRGIQLYAPQKEKEPLLKIQKIFGGSIYQCRTEYIMFNWYLSGRNAAQCMMTVYCLMSRRRKQKIKIAMDFWKQTNIEAKYRTHCPARHPYNEINTRVNKKGHRECRECHRIRELNRRHKNAGRIITENCCSKISGKREK